MLLKRSLNRTDSEKDLNYPEIRYKCAIVHKYFCNCHRNRKIETVEENDILLKLRHPGCIVQLLTAGYKQRQ